MSVPTQMVAPPDDDGVLRRFSHSGGCDLGQRLLSHAPDFAGTDFPEAGDVLSMAETEELIDFIEREGTLHIIADLGECPRRYTDLEERVPISTSTLADRLEEGVRLDLLELDRVVDEDGDRKVYRLTTSGRNAYKGLEHHGGVEASQKTREGQATLDEVQQLFADRLRADG